MVRRTRKRQDRARAAHVNVVKLARHWSLSYRTSLIVCFEKSIWFSPSL